MSAQFITFMLLALLGGEATRSGALEYRDVVVVVVIVIVVVVVNNFFELLLVLQ